MTTRTLLQPAWVIHRRPFRNTSLLVDFFSRDCGRIATVARGARRSKSPMHGLLQPFRPLRVSWSGRGDIKTLTAAESAGPAASLAGERLFSGFYVNELLSRLLHDHVEHPHLYQTYEETWLALASNSPLEPALRRFELELLAELGYAINLQTDCEHNEAIVAGKHYRYVPDVGFEEAEESANAFTTDNTDAATGVHGAGQASEAAGASKRIFSGAHLLALGRLELADPEAAATAKRLLRQALEPHLGGKPLNSRALFAQAGSPKADRV